MHIRRFLPPSLAIATALIGLWPIGAQANWIVRNVTNHTNQPVTYALSFGPGTSNASTASQVRGDAVLVIPSTGALMFKDIGHDSPCSRPYWAVAITLNDRKWHFYYDGNGAVDVTVAADGTVTLTPASEGSQVTEGNNRPVCRQ
jgi:hypothetical protein